ETPNVDDIARGLSVSFSNVLVISVGSGTLSGVPAQAYNVQYSVGTPAGTQWVRSVSTSTMTVPDVSWTVTCCGQGSSVTEAQKAFDYWQLEFLKFLTFIKFLR
ncbi:hypothetical protein JZU68_09005, partial [bacterium]|nr:hypothetical protein [bacterium]